MLKGVTYFDLQPFASFYVESYLAHYQHDIRPDYYELDPTGVFPHPFRVSLTNHSARDMEMAFMVTLKFIVVGTERPETKR